MDKPYAEVRVKKDSIQETCDHMLGLYTLADETFALYVSTIDGYLDEMDCIEQFNYCPECGAAITWLEYIENESI